MVSEFPQFVIPQFIKMLSNLSAIMDKGVKYAEAKKFEPEVLWNARLAPDQLNFIKQIQIACDTAKLCVARLANKEAPSHADNEKTLPELKARIDSVVTYLKGFSPSDFSGWDSRKITTPRWEGKWMTGEEFLWNHAIPNFYFHITTAYSNLRHNGVDIGKKDYLGEMPFKK